MNYHMFVGTSWQDAEGTVVTQCCAQYGYQQDGPPWPSESVRVFVEDGVWWI